ncbi:MAG: alpha/beta hydrolase [bacterium]
MSDAPRGRLQLKAALPVEMCEPSRAARSTTNGATKAPTSILLVHGFWTWSRHWKDAGARLAEAGFSVHALSLRGHHPDYPIADLGKVHLNDFAEDVIRVAGEIPGLNCLMGHSLGGLLCMKAAERVPVTRLVLLSPSPPAGVPFRKSPAAALGILRHAYELCAARPMRPDFWIARRTFLLGLPIAKQQEIYRTWIKDSGTALREAALANLIIDFSTLRARARVVVGSDDNVTPPPAVRRTAELLNAEYKEYPATGHHLMEYPAWPQILNDIIQWLSA